MKTIVCLSALCLMLSSVNAQDAELVRNTLKTASIHLSRACQKNVYPFRYPRSTNPDGTLKTVESRDWTSGFFPGNLWLMYEHTQDKRWLELARKWTMGLEKEKDNKGTHDLGFMLYCSFGNGLRLTGDNRYKEILIEGARSLITRFHPTVGCIKSWDHGAWEFPVIIDNMMNLELLFWATKVTGDSTFYNVAVQHANTTMKNHFRPDYSSYHVVDYDTATGAVRSKGTHQGFSDESAWARGQSWALYGFIIAYRETRDFRYLQQAEKIASFILSHPNLPSDKIPYWDYDCSPREGQPKDASAAAISASALFELADYSSEGNRWRDAARRIIRSLASPAYLAKPGTNNNFILMHSVGHKPGNSEIDVPLIYADYYLIEALLRWKKANERKN